MNNVDIHRKTAIRILCLKVVGYSARLLYVDSRNQSYTQDLGPRSKPGSLDIPLDLFDKYQGRHSSAFSSKSRHSTLHARFPQPRSKKRAMLLYRRTENREEFNNPVVSKRLLDKIGSNSPPSKN